MQPTADRPPYVVFEIREIENRDESIATGRYVSRDVDFIVVTPSGSKDRIEREYSDWLRVKEQETSENRFNPMWLDQYKLQYKRWKEGQEEPEKGTSLLNWPILPPAMRRMLIDLNVRTVEDMAAAPEDVLMRIGIGARGYKQKAADYLAAAEGPGKVSERLDSLEANLAAEKVRSDSLESQLNTYVAKYGKMEGKAA